MQKGSLPELPVLSILSGPVLRDTARLSQRYPPIARYGVFGVSAWPIGCDFLSNSPLESMRSGGAIPPPQKWYLSDTCAIPYENEANGCDTPLCDTISKGYCAIWGGISHWAAECPYRTHGDRMHTSGDDFLTLMQGVADSKRAREFYTESFSDPGNTGKLVMSESMHEVKLGPTWYKKQCPNRSTEVCNTHVC